jgi:streptogramin lyase
MRVFGSLVLFLCAFLLAGCAGTPVITTTQSNTTTRAVIRGRVHGGQNPIQGAHVYVLALSSTAYGGPGIAPSASNASSSLLTSGDGSDSLGYYVTTDANGNFSVTSDYTCPSGQSNDYFYAVGGNPGTGSNNSAITLVAPFESCSPSSFTVINEVSTVTTTFVFAGFITDVTHVGSSGSTLALSSLNIGGGTLSNLLNISTGLVPTSTSGANGTIPMAEIDTLANILAACINSSGPSSTQCTTLFSNAMSGGTAPTDTADAAVNIAHNPGANVANLFALQTASSPFQPMLAAAPNDFTIALTFTGGGLNSPFLIAIDAAGDAWITNNAAHSVSEFGSDGSAISPAAGFGGGGLADPAGIAIDASGNVWVANTGLIAGVLCNCISKLSSNATPISPGAGYTGGGLAQPMGIAVDASGNVWVTNTSTNSISEFNSSGVAQSGSGGITTGGLNAPIFPAIDGSGNLWVSNSGGNDLSEFNSSGTAKASSPFGGGGLNNPRAIVVDASNNIWVASRGNNVLGEFNSSGAAVTSTGYTGGGLNQPNFPAVDGGGNVWITDRGGNTISEFNSGGNAVTGSTGYQAGLSTPISLAIDGAGNLWVANYGNNTITEFVGVATPVVTPLVANFIGPYSHAASKP